MGKNNGKKEKKLCYLVVSTDRHRYCTYLYYTRTHALQVACARTHDIHPCVCVRTRVPPLIFALDTQAHRDRERERERERERDSQSTQRERERER